MELKGSLGSYCLSLDWKDLIGFLLSIWIPFSLGSFIYGYLLGLSSVLKFLVSLRFYCLMAFTLLVFKALGSFSLLFLLSIFRALGGLAAVAFEL